MSNRELIPVADITVAAPRGEVVVLGGWAHVGSLLERDGQVRIRPRCGLTQRQSDRLQAAADQVWLLGRDSFAAEHWQWIDGLGWVTGVSVRERHTQAPVRCKQCRAVRS